MHPSLLNIKIKCWENILDSPLSWRQRSSAHNHLAELYHERYYIRTAIISKKIFELDKTEGSWYLFEDY